MDSSTAAYEDVDKILERVEQELIVGKGMNAILCVGDQQTFSRMWHLKAYAAKKYEWAIPCSGDFHYQFYVASGINRAAYDSILKRFVNNADMPKTVKRRMDNTCHIKYIDNFYQLVIKSALIYLTGVYGQEDMTKNPGTFSMRKRRTWVSAFLAAVLF